MLYESQAPARAAPLPPLPRHLPSRRGVAGRRRSAGAASDRDGRRDASVEGGLDGVDLGCRATAAPRPRPGSGRPSSGSDRRHPCSDADPQGEIGASPGSTRYCASHPVRISGLPPTRVATTGTPHASGSITDRDSGSGHRLGTTATSAAWIERDDVGLRRQPRHRQALRPARAARPRSAPSRRDRRRATATPPRPDGPAPGRPRPRARTPARARRPPSRVRSDRRRGPGRRRRTTPSLRAGRRRGPRRGRDVAGQVDPGEHDAGPVGAERRPRPPRGGVTGHRHRAVAPGPGTAQPARDRPGGGRHRWKTTGAPTRAPTRHRVGDVPVAVDVHDVGPGPAPGAHSAPQHTHRGGGRVAPTGERPGRLHHGPREAAAIPRRSRPRSRRRGRRRVPGRPGPGSSSVGSARGPRVRRDGWPRSGCARTVTIQGRSPVPARRGWRPELARGPAARLV